MACIWLVACIQDKNTDRLIIASNRLLLSINMSEIENK